MSRVSVTRARAAASPVLAAVLTVVLTAPLGARSLAGDVGTSVGGASVSGASVAGRLQDPRGRAGVPPWSGELAGGEGAGDRAALGGSTAGDGPVGDPTDVAAWLAQAGDPASVLVVVNKRRPLTPADHVPADLDDASGVLLRADASAAFVGLAAAAEAAGIPVRARSGYRSFLDQQVTYRRWQRLLGDAAADAQSARPGHSEHQTGLAVDVVTRDGCQEFGCFAETAQAAWLAQRAADHGFLVRYQSDQDAITGYAAEAWHLRFVGVEAARAVVASGAGSIEEYLGLPAAPTY